MLLLSHIVLYMKGVSSHPETSIVAIPAASAITFHDNKDAESSTAQERGPSKDMDKDGGDDDGRKATDVNWILTFQFELSDFVKELLNPTWREGQLSKDVCKTLVKKVVHKVTDTVRGAHVPQTIEDID
ncbi:hypothetical protein Nepgr_023771 [Nepenthes gracilis]|uniref:Uncharacterized protein n=1 Tax=Nepenthes gracilis TaxID=150966 RepID=A0AAD3XY54_NEPGR|nr:hypothetical protein Nepgr_023771 [Nepenthes gracilis]